MYILKTTDKMEDMEEDLDVFLAGCDWLDNLADDPYYRGLQDKVPAAFVGVSRGAVCQ